MVYAPIILIVYTRLNNLISLVESLQRNPEARLTDIFIVSDAASKDKDVPMVNAVREYSYNITGFNSVNVIAPELNSRLYNIDYIGQLKKDLLLKYDSFIVLEDDNVVSKHFLRYMNEALDFYKDAPNIGCICGYKAPFELPVNYKKDIYLGLRYSPWGYGMHKKWYESIDLSVYDRYQIAIKKKNIRKFKLLGSDILSILDRDSLGEIDAFDARVVYHQVMNGLYSVFPSKSLVRNVGFDGSGEHCGETDRYYVELNEDDEYNIKLISDIQPDKEVLKAFKKFMDVESLSDKIRNTVRFLPKLILRKLGLLSKVRNILHKS